MKRPSHRVAFRTLESSQTMTVPSSFSSSIRLAGVALAAMLLLGACGKDAASDAKAAQQAGRGAVHGGFAGNALLEAAHVEAVAGQAHGGGQQVVPGDAHILRHQGLGQHDGKEEGHQHAGDAGEQAHHGVARQARTPWQ